MGTVLAVAMSALAVGSAGAATIDWGAPGTVTSSPSVTTGSLTTTVTGGSSYEVLQEGAANNFWTGEFANGANVLYDKTSGVVDLTFSAPVTNLSLGVEPDLYGAFTATAQIYDNGVLVDTINTSGANKFGAGALATISYAGPVTAVDLTVSNAAQGVAVGPVTANTAVSAAPEPGALVLMGVGGLVVGALAYGRRRVVA